MRGLVVCESKTYQPQNYMWSPWYVELKAEACSSHVQHYVGWQLSNEKWVKHGDRTALHELLVTPENILGALKCCMTCCQSPKFDLPTCVHICRMTSPKQSHQPVQSYVFSFWFLRNKSSRTHTHTHIMDLVTMHLFFLWTEWTTQTAVKAPE